MSTNSTPPTGKDPTLKDMHFFYAVFNSQEGSPKINWDQVATVTGLKNGSTASVRFGQIKKKLGLTSNGAISTQTSPRAKKGTARLVGKVTKPRGRPATKSKPVKQEKDCNGNIDGEKPNNDLDNADDQEIQGGSDVGGEQNEQGALGGHFVDAVETMEYNDGENPESNFMKGLESEAGDDSQDEDGVDDVKNEEHVEEENEGSSSA
ncbi:MAG: hypothetical protein M1833_003334 [Piccolia ochrophora]|nr:MAG: hypothetical protein M1833_003334 [Piccolia ochrophora]